jgi:hypothetical protein
MPSSISPPVEGLYRPAAFFSDRKRSLEKGAAIRPDSLIKSQLRGKHNPSRCERYLPFSDQTRLFTAE